MNPHVPNINPMTFENLTQIDGPLERHIEQLWDEIKRLKERVIELEKRPIDDPSKNPSSS